MLNGKDTIIYLIVGLIKKHEWILFKGKCKNWIICVHLCNKSRFKNAIGIDT